MNHNSEFQPIQNIRIFNVLYARCSTLLQNTDRQLVDKDRFDMVVEEHVSGRIPCADRLGFQKILHLINKHKGDDSIYIHIHVITLERLGRNLKDLIQIISLCTEAGVCIVCENQGIRTLDGNKKPNLTSILLCHIMSVIESWNLEAQKIVRDQGIAIAKAKKKYRGRKPGSKIPTEVFLERNAKAVEYLKQGLLAKDVAILTNKHVNTISKIKRIAKIR